MFMNYQTNRPNYATAKFSILTVTIPVVVV